MKLNKTISNVKKNDKDKEINWSFIKSEGIIISLDLFIIYVSTIYDNTCIKNKNLIIFFAKYIFLGLQKV